MSYALGWSQFEEILERESIHHDGEPQRKAVEEAPGDHRDYRSPEVSVRKEVEQLMLCLEVSER